MDIEHLDNITVETVLMRERFEQDFYKLPASLQAEPQLRRTLDIMRRHTDAILASIADAKQILQKGVSK